MNRPHGSHIGFVEPESGSKSHFYRIFFMGAGIHFKRKFSGARLGRGDFT